MKNVTHKNAPGAISAIAFIVRPPRPNVGLVVGFSFDDMSFSLTSIRILQAKTKALTRDLASPRPCEFSPCVSYGAAEMKERFSNEDLLIRQAGADVIGLIDVHDKDTSVADLSGPRGLGHDFDNVINLTILGNNFDSRFRQECDLVFEAAIDSRLSFLMTMSANFRNSDPRCHALDPLDEVGQLFRTDDALDEFHDSALCH